MGNEKGFTYPILLMVIVLFGSYLTFQIQFFLSEKQLYHESRTILKQEYYMHVVVKKIETSLQNNSISIGTGKFTFYSGTANFQVEAYSTNLLKTTIKFKLNTLEEIVGIAYYDKTQKKMTKWVERN